MSDSKPISMDVPRAINFIAIRAAVTFLVGFGTACGTRGNQSEEVRQNEYFLEKVNFLRIDRETDVRILDYHPGKRQFLAVDKVTEEFLVLDSRGQVLEEIYRRGEGPNEFNTNLLAFSFNQEEGGYFAQSSIEQIRFNDAWDVDQRIRFASYYSIFFYTGPKMSVPYYRIPGVSTPFFFTSFFSGVNTNGGGEADPEVAGHLIEQYNPQKQELEWVLPFVSQLLPEFERDDKNENKKPGQVYALDRKEGRLLLTFDRSMEIGIYNLNNHFDFVGQVGFTHRSFSLSSKAKNIALFDFGRDIFGVIYFEGLSEAATATRKENDPGYFPLMDPTLYHLIVLEDGKQQEKEIDFPPLSDPRSEIMPLPGNRLLLRDKYMGDTKPEFHLYAIFELKVR